MKNQLEQSRMTAVEKYLNGESPKSICAALNKSKPWLYKWVARYDPDTPHWYRDRSRSPIHPRTVGSAIEAKVVETRKLLEEQSLFCGPQSILWQLEDEGIQSLPGISTVKRIIKRNHLTKRRSGRYQPKGKPYPGFPDTLPNQMHHMDYLGPRYLAGPVRFYCLSSMDVATKRCATSPIPNRALPTAIETIWGIWFRLGIPVYLQVDNELAFRGSNRYPRSLGGIIRLCLHNGVRIIFIPLAEPWRNFAVEKLHDHLQDKWLRKSTMETWDDLHEGALHFERKHNGSYRYSKLRGKTPLQALQESETTLHFPDTRKPPKKLDRPRKGKIHLIRFIRSNRRLDVFGECFTVAPKLVYEYVVATIDVKEQKLKVYLDQKLAQVFNYTLSS